jgi:hypothetical protein
MLAEIIILLFWFDGFIQNGLSQIKRKKTRFWPMGGQWKRVVGVYVASKSMPTGFGK